MRLRTTTSLVALTVMAGMSITAPATASPVRPADPPPLDAAVDARPDHLGDCVATDPTWGLEASAQCVSASRAYLDGDDQLDVAALYRAGGPGATWRTATWTSTRPDNLSIGALRGADGAPLIDGDDAYPFRIAESVDPRGDHHGAVQIVEFTGANTLTLSWQTSSDGGPLAPITYTDVSAAGVETTEGGSATQFSKTVCTDVDRNGTIDAVYVRGIIDDATSPLAYAVQADAVQWNSDGTVTSLPVYDNVTGYVSVDDYAELPDTGPGCDGADDPDLLAIMGVS